MGDEERGDRLTSPPATIDTFYVVFQDRMTNAWWDGLVGPGFRHCWIIKPSYSPDRSLTSLLTSVIIEPVGDYLAVDHLAKKPREAALNALKDEVTTAVIAVRITVPPPKGQFPRGLRGMMTCVSIIKNALGIHAWWVWTPKSLCDYLLTHRNGHLVKED